MNQQLKNLLEVEKYYWKMGYQGIIFYFYQLSVK